MPSILQYGFIPVLGFIYFLAVLILFRGQVQKHAPTVYKLFKYGLAFKLISSVLVEIVYIHYYGYGDTLVYYREATFFLEKVANNPLDLFRLFSLTPSEYKVEFAEIIKNTGTVFDYYNQSTVRMIKITSFLSIFSFNNIFGTGMLYGSLCYIGLWYLYRVLIYHLPHINQKLLFAAIVFMPSVMFWGSGILKEPIAIFLLCIVFYVLHKLVIRREFSLVAILIFLFCFGLLVKLKSFFLIVFYPSFALFVLYHYINEIRPSLLRKSSKLFSVLILSLLIIISPFILMSTGLDQAIMGSTFEYIMTYSQNLSENTGSSYDLGLAEPSLIGLITVMPQAIIVSLFRPFLWESNKIVVLVSAIESTFVVGLTFYFVLKGGILHLFSNLLKHPILIFLLTFTLIFATVVGVSSGNFGALARYKIPCIPFYISFLVATIQIHKTSRNNKKI